MPRPFRRSSYATRLFVALFLLSALPSLILVGTGTWALHRYVSLTGSLGAWGRVAETGKTLLDEVEERAPSGSELARAAQAHRDELSRSIAFARRFELLGGRLARALPFLALALWVLLVGMCALWVARKLAAQMSKPVGELVGWARVLARGERLPEPGAREERGAPEFRALRAAFREMAARLEQGRARALEAERLRAWTEMARRVAHELKNPLTPLRLARDQLERALARHPEAVAATREPMRVLVEESQRLEEMARSFAQLGRLPEGPMSEIDLREMLTQLVAAHASERPHAEVHLPGDLPLIRGHHDALSRVFRNLLLNALDAVQGQANPEVRVSAELTDGSVRVRVTDTGPGIDPAIFDRIWDPDFTTKSRGTGLGLALVRQTVRAHGGDVEARNVSGGGAEFVVTLPIGPAPGLDSAGAGPETGGAL